MGGTYQLSWLYKRNKWVFNPAQKEFKSGESLRERGNGFQTEGAADMKLLRPYRLNFIFGTHKSLEWELRRARAGKYLVTNSRR